MVLLHTARRGRRDIHQSLANCFFFSSVGRQTDDRLVSCAPSLGRGVSCPVVKASSAGGETSSTRFRLWVISEGKGKRIEFPETTVDFSQGDGDGSCVVSLDAQMMQTRNADADEELSRCFFNKMCRSRRCTLL